MTEHHSPDRSAPGNPWNQENRERRASTTSQARPGRDNDERLGDPWNREPDLQYRTRVPTPRENAERDRREEEQLPAAPTTGTGTGWELPAPLLNMLTWSLAALSSILGLVVIAQGAAAVQTISSLPTPLSRIAGIAALVCSSCISALIVKLGLALTRLRRTPSINIRALDALTERRSWQHLAQRKAEEARTVLRVHVEEYDSAAVRRHLTPADRGRLEETRRRLLDDTDHSSPTEWLADFANHFQEPIDRAASRRIRHYALRAGAASAVSRFTILDQVIVLTACFALLKDTLSLYGLRPTATQTALFLARSVAAAYMAGVIQDAADHAADTADTVEAATNGVDEGLGEDLLAKLGEGAANAASTVGSAISPLAGRTAEALFNAITVHRLGSAAVRLVQPTRRS